MLKYHRDHYKYQWYYAHFSLQDLTIKKKIILEGQFQSGHTGE